MDLRIVSRCGDQEVKRLHSCIAGTLGHNIKQFSVRLGMQLIKNTTPWILKPCLYASADST
jgi:hypothetical protein